jgi:hypothetical protein
MVINERTSPLRFQEMQSLLQQHRTDLFQELQIKFGQERARLLPEVNTMLQKQYLYVKREVESKIKQEREQVLAATEKVAQERVAAEVQMQLQTLLQQPAVVSPVAHQAHVASMLEVTEVLNKERSYLMNATKDLMQQQITLHFDNNRSHTFKAIQDFVQQHITKLSDSMKSELASLLSKINNVSSSCEQHLGELTSNYSTCLSTLQELKGSEGGSVKGVLIDRLTQIEGERAAATGAVQDLKLELQEFKDEVAGDREVTMGALEDVRLSVDGVDLRVSGYTMTQNEIAEKVAALGDESQIRQNSIISLATSLDQQSTKIGEVFEEIETQRKLFADLGTSLSAQTTGLTNIVAEQKEEQQIIQSRCIEVQSQVTEVQSQVEQSLQARQADLQVTQSTEQDRGDLDKALNAQGIETRMLNDRLTALEKASEEFSDEVQEWMSGAGQGLKRGKKGQRAGQSLDRYREILSLREQD